MSKRSIVKFARLLPAIAVVLGMVIAPAGQAVAAPVAPAAGYGFGQGFMAVENSFDDTNRELDAVGQTSASWLRVPIDWNAIEGTRGQYDWGYLDNIVNSAGAHGLRVLGLLGFSPPWARPGGATMLFPSAPPANNGDFAGFVTAVVQRYGDRISNWEVWNEPNLPIFFGFADKRAQRYADVLKAAYPAIKAAQPGSTVVAAGLSRASGADAPPAFLQQMYDAGAGGFFDAAASHPYVTPGGLAANSKNGWSDMLAMHDVMARNGDGGKQIWLTEIGAPTCSCYDGVSQDEQAKQITDVLAAAAGLPFVGPAFIYSVRDVNTGDQSSRERNYGALLTTDWQPKASAAVLAR